MIGTPARCASRFAAVFSPNISRCSGVGPMKRKPSASAALAKSAFSARNPYPGWIASTPLWRAMARMAAMFRYERTGSPPLSGPI